jgi:hypothetical protein
MNTRTYANPIEPGKAEPFSAPAEAVLFPLTGPQALLVHQSLNELLHGIRGIHIYSQVGISKVALGEIFASLNLWLQSQSLDANGLPFAGFVRSFSVGEIRALRNAVELVMLDLGHEEFFTRTGFTLVEAAELLDRFNATLLDPLQIDRQPRQIAH